MAPLSYEDLLERNRVYAGTHQPLPLLSEIKAEGRTGPKIVVFSCCDPRVVPEKFLQLGPGEALVIRNVGGRVARNINDLITLDLLFGLETVMVVQHTDCGTTHFRNEDMREKLRGVLDSQVDASALASVDFGAIADLEESVREDLAFMRDNPLVRKELARRAHGFLYDVKTGKLTEVPT